MTQKQNANSVDKLDYTTNENHYHSIQPNQDNNGFQVDTSLIDRYRQKLAERVSVLDDVRNKNKQNVPENEPEHRDNAGACSDGVRSSNTYTEKLKSSNRKSANVVDYKPSNNVVFCDYLKTSVRDVDMRDELLYTLARKNGVFRTVGITINEVKNKNTGYDNTAELRMKNPDDHEDTFNAGFFCFSDSGKMKGGYIELKGRPCQIMQSQYPEQWNELIDELEYHGWRLSSADLALDIHGDLALDKGITVPKLDMQAGEGLFTSGKVKNKNISAVGRYPQGDWSDINDGRTSRKDYDPREFCLDGLTIYIGSKRSADRWKCYEKEKEMLSKGKGSSGNANELAWVRIEHTMKKTTTKPVNWNALREPDKHFSRDRAGLIEIMQDVRKRAKLDNVVSVVSETIKKTKSTKLRHGLFWANQSSCKAVLLAKREGMTNDQIINELTAKRSVSREIERIATFNAASVSG